MKYYIVYSNNNEFETKLFSNYLAASDYAYNRIMDCIGKANITNERIYSTDDSYIYNFNFGDGIEDDYFVVIEPVVPE